MNEYDDVKEAFEEKDWVYGINKHIGCSPVFDHDTDNPQPFSYLNETDPTEFRLATIEEISSYANIPEEAVIKELKNDGTFK